MGYFVIFISLLLCYHLVDSSLNLLNYFKCVPSSFVLKSEINFKNLSSVGPRLCPSSCTTDYLLSFILSLLFQIIFTGYSETKVSNTIFLNTKGQGCTDRPKTLGFVQLFYVLVYSFQNLFTP